MKELADLLSLDDRQVQMLLAKLEEAEFALALKGASDEVKQLFLRNMSTRGTLEVDTEGLLMGAPEEGAIAAARARMLELASEVQAEA
ncbi:MAG: hypothetical protein KDB07_08045 [Planctomycetes bacterium]|nr:hypothetical protein [Planctomycetota bacterium]